MAREIPYIDTTVSVEKTVVEIEAILLAHGASTIVKEFESGRIKAVAFKHEGVPFQLPAKVDSVYQYIHDKKKDTNRWRFASHNEIEKAKQNWHSQAERCAWRNIMFWVKAQLALVEIGMVTITQVFLPYMLTSGSQTLYERMLSEGLSEGLLALPEGEVS